MMTKPERDARILALRAEGKSQLAISIEMSLSINTVKNVIGRAKAGKQNDQAKRASAA